MRPCPCGTDHKARREAKQREQQNQIKRGIFG
jgi:hypothetical protein